MRLEVFATVDHKRAVNKMICSATGGQYAHAGLLFTATKEEFDSLCSGTQFGVKVDQLYVTPDRLTAWPDGMYRFYFESIAKKDKYTRKSGVRGPYTFQKIVNWQNEKDGREFGLFPVTALEKREMIALVHKLLAWTKTIKYPLQQLKWNWLTSRIRIGIPPSSRTPNKWDCSETVVRAFRDVAPDYAAETFGLGDWLFDEMAPSSGKKHVPGVVEMIEKGNLQEK